MIDAQIFGHLTDFSRLKRKEKKKMKIDVPAILTLISKNHKKTLLQSSTIIIIIQIKTRTKI
jgi:hypothetical protein